jgi:hypothetical protein
MATMVAIIKSRINVVSAYIEAALPHHVSDPLKTILFS